MDDPRGTHTEDWSFTREELPWYKDAKRSIHGAQVDKEVDSGQ